MEEKQKGKPGKNSYQLYQFGESMRNLIEIDNPNLKPDDFIPVEKVIEYRKKYLTKIIEDEHGEIDALERTVVEAISKSKILSESTQPEIDEQTTVGQRMADKIALFGGSWTFIIVFFSFILIWMVINIVVLANKAYDPYPFILLNLILSCLAAIQAPIIMMSQNRQEQKDRIRSEHDYKINLKAELEIQLLHEKLDHLMIHQNKKLLEIQQLQVDYFDDVLRQIKK